MANVINFILACDFPDVHDDLRAHGWFPANSDRSVWQHPDYDRATLVFNYKSMRGHTVNRIFFTSDCLDLEYWTEVVALFHIHKHHNNTRIYLLGETTEYPLPLKGDLTPQQRAARGLRHLASMVEKGLVSLTDINTFFSKELTSSGLPASTEIHLIAKYDVKHLPMGTTETQHRMYLNDLNSILQTTGPYDHVITNGEDHG